MSVLSRMAKKKRFSLEETPNIFYKKIQNILTNFSDSDVDKINEPFLMAKIAEACTDSEVLHDKIHQMRDVITIREQQIESQSAEINELEFMNKEDKSKIDEYNINQENLTLAIKILVSVIIALIILLIYILSS